MLTESSEHLENINPSLWSGWYQVSPLESRSRRLMFAMYLKKFVCWGPSPFRLMLLSFGELLAFSEGESAVCSLQLVWHEEILQRPREPY